MSNIITYLPDLWAHFALVLSAGSSVCLCSGRGGVSGGGVDGLRDDEAAGGAAVAVRAGSAASATGRGR